MGDFPMLQANRWSAALVMVLLGGVAGCEEAREAPPQETQEQAEDLGTAYQGVGPVGADNGVVRACTGPLPAGTPAVICVDGAAPAGGTGTAGAPHRTIAAAFTAAKAGDTIQIAGGTYLENPVIGAFNSGNAKRLDILGGFQPGTGFTVRNQAVYRTVIDGGLVNPGLRLFVNGGASSMVVDGLAITRGKGLGTAWNNGYGHGGGIYVQWFGTGTLTISHVELWNNQTNSVAANSQLGGGLWAITQSTGPVRLEDSYVHDNKGGKGAAVGAQGRVSLLRNRFEGNLGQNDHGGGLYLSLNGGLVESNLIKNNRIGVLAGYGWGGGVAFIGGSAAMKGNVVTGNAAPLIGAGVFWDEGAVGSMTNDLVFRNTCPNDARSGAAVYVDGAGSSGPGSIVTMTNVTVADHACPNQGSTGGAVYLERQSRVTVRDSIFWGNTRDFGGDAGTTFTATHTTTTLAGDGNTAQNPLFVDAAAGDYHLKSTAGHWSAGGWIPDAVTSPAIDAGDPAAPFALEPSPNGSRVDRGAYGNTAEASRSATLDFEACPGQPHPLAFGQTQVITGTLVGSTDDVDTCGTADGGDRIYRLDLAQPGGTLRLTLDEPDGALDAKLVVRTTCDDGAGELCASASADAESIVLEPTTSTLFVVVDAASGAGAFTLTAAYDAAACGDGLLNTGEECEPPTPFCVPPGQADACTSTAPDPAAETCPGKAIAVAEGATTLTADAADLTTVNYGDDLQASCAPTPGGQDHVLALTPAVSGTLTVRVGFDAAGELVCDADTCTAHCWDAVLSARASCADPGSEIACASDTFGGEELVIPVTAGVPVSVIVDGVNAGFYARGPFDLQLELEAD